MAIVNAQDRVERLMDWKDFGECLKSAAPDRRLAIYMRLLDFMAPRKQATPAEEGKRVKDNADMIIESLFKKEGND
jgi:hypothetical protein